MKSEIKIIKYDPNWIRTFELEKSHISSLLGEEAISIEHIGSTSIPGQDAKPIIDIFAGVSPFQEAAHYKSLFHSESYRYIQTDMSGRYLFSKYTSGTWSHNIHVIPFNDEFYIRNEFLLRDYLRAHPELMQEYGKIKKISAKNHGNTMEEYTRSKTEFIQKVIDAARTEKGLPLQNVWEN
ncbi:GrpB family protein [Metabacillus arenae]|uniref:GrpB family protein n=1 Tax=Metabacillus arenae TaxID=2771434 RepID=A0A926NF37_9BACI|nr:GrpB family protein [Metabacillus arenae]MBD1379650.1 GrpB family protein [Metabacillus arenae]